MKFTIHAKNFINYMSNHSGFSSFTVRNYTGWIKKFLEYCGHITPSKLTVEDIINYRLSLRAKGTLSENSITLYIVGVRQFLHFCWMTNVKTLHWQKVPLPKKKRQNISCLDQIQMHKLLDSIIISTKIDLRDKAILEMFYSTGLRVRELTSINRDQVDLIKRSFTIMGKGEKPRLIFLSERAAYWLRKWLEYRTDDNKALFTNYRDSYDKDKRLSTTSIQKMVRKRAENAGIKVTVTPHTIRHSFASIMLENGADIRAIQLMLGHEKITTTQIYLHIADKKLQKIHLQFNTLTPTYPSPPPPRSQIIRLAPHGTYKGIDRIK